MSDQLEVKRLFNSAAEFTVEIMSGGKRRAKVRFPTDREWCERARKLELVQKDLGRQEYTSELTGKEAADAALFAKIRLDASEEGEEFDGADASAFVSRLLDASVSDVEPAPDAFRLTLRAMRRFDTVHTLRMPRQRDLVEFRRQTARRRIGNGYEKVNVSLEPSSALYDKLLVSVEGYSGDVPVIHKDVALTEVLRQIAILEEPPEE